MTSQDAATEGATAREAMDRARKAAARALADSFDYPEDDDPTYRESYWLERTDAVIAAYESSLRETSGTRLCQGCGGLKTPDEFYQRGHVIWCSDCENRRKREHRPPRDPVVEQRAKVRWKARNAEKMKAHAAVRNAVRRGEMTRPVACETCAGQVPLHGHHEDYSRPLDVQWLCPTCHKAAHKEKEAAT